MKAGTREDRDGVETAETLWLRLSDGLISGIHHALNNRMAALGAASQVLEADLPGGHPLAGLLSGEVQRLESTVTLLRLLTQGDTENQPIQIAETLTDAKLLFEIHRSLSDSRLEIIYPTGLLPLWTQPAGLLRAVMLLLHAALERCPGQRGTVQLRASGDEAHISIEVSARADRRAEPHETTGGGEHTGSAGIGALAEELGGHLVFAAEGLRLTLPTLTEVRRRERA